MVALEEVAMEIYWGAYDQYIDSIYAHPKDFTKEVAWEKAAEAQRIFCRNQARRAMKVCGV